ncbi:glycosyltransferase [Flavobacterium sp. K77]|uniref:glycosyltransferase family 2 protein n=1 Tax=Flavobacterium sp. K77 TaxID=2910676 RepID=UPI001F2D2322|nr:glycosyltransferase [Flavobacterium sp. K77]MCF6141401.1 glycosyltransferase [Flavobacterium sp. K77]
MVTLVLTNRNRDFRIVKKCLDSLLNQTNDAFELFFIDYGSDSEYVVALKVAIQAYPKIKLILCPVNGQLWNKSRAINIALKQTTTPYFLVGDVDLIFAPHFINTVYTLMNDQQVWYFQYGFLAQQESLLNKSFEDYTVDFKGSPEVTGTTLFPTSGIQSINGFDEFYHGWGAEDTDMHVRMQLLGYAIKFYDSDCIIKHQWHAKQYRNKKSKHPFHIGLEQINHEYLQLTKTTKRLIVNQKQPWGLLAEEFLYQKLNNATFDNSLQITNSVKKVNAVLSQLHNFKDESIHLKIVSIGVKERWKNKIKNRIANRIYDELELESINSLILEQIVQFHRNNPYHYTYDRKAKFIELKMIF